MLTEYVSIAEKRSRPPSFVHIIVGSTGLGKSATAVGLARVTGAPVLVADRIQCFTDLATTVARADGNDVPGVERIFLCDRTVDEGDYPLHEAREALLRKLESLTENHRFVIVEGGSISLQRSFAELLPELPYRLSVRCLRIPGTAEYLAMLTRRVRGMLRPEPPGRSMFDELSAAWECESQRSFLASILGFDVILQWCAEHSCGPGSLAAEAIPCEQFEKLAMSIAGRHAEYGFMQDRIFSSTFREEDQHYVWVH